MVLHSNVVSANRGCGLAGANGIDENWPPVSVPGEDGQLEGGKERQREVGVILAMRADQSVWSCG